MLTEKGHWQQLLDRAEAISNGADRVVVVSIVASCAGGTGPFADNKWFERVRRDILAIPSDRDRIDRFRWVAEIIESFDKSLCRRILREAMNLSNHLGDLDGIGDCRQKMLDLAHNIDAGFCGEMIDLLDGDEAKAAKKDLKDHTRLLDHRKDAASDVSKLASEDLSIEELAEIASRNLAALNADRHIAQPTKEFLPLVTQIRSAPLPQAYPIWQWILENGIKKATQQIGPKVLPPLYETFCSAADVTLMLVGRSGLSERSAPLGPVESIGPGDRDQVFARLQEWASSRGGKKIQISDPFFGPDDLDIVKAIAEVCPDSEIEILTSRKQMQQKLRDASAEDAFKDAWERLCEVPPPPTDIIVVGFGGDGEHPIHDRWIVGESSGLRLGTSANSLGHLRVSEMSELDQAQTIERGLLIDKVLNKGTRDWQGHKLSRVRFSL
ncbi:hypothetical protein A9975_26810 [Cupriavidus sp. UME77]|nr:hypothetical protein [Cupriavidus sp. UME77]